MHQLERLVELGVPALAGLEVEEFRGLGRRLPDRPDAFLAVHPSLVPAAELAPLLSRSGKPGFVVEDLTDLDRFTPIPAVEVPDQPLYLVAEPDRGDDLLNWSPDEALPELTRRGRTPFTISEGISWLLQQPDRLEPNRCFMCVGSRTTNARGKLDARTPAIWISGGTGRDGKERKNAPKVGWCWAGSRHTWLGFGSTTGRLG
ncbi:DUF5701 family protein [Microlunatus sp. GCM10028923]|uniref:DUF5701 family protein n=1 Tax=Microlunatus sp. GCM10028923 TaxID=3273400 RepID=UPI0036109BBC